MLTWSNQERIEFQYRRLAKSHIFLHEIIIMNLRWLHSQMKLRIRNDSIASWINSNLELTSFAISLVRRILLSNSINENHVIERSNLKSYTVKIKVMMSRQINDASIEKKSYLRIVINNIVDFVLIFQIAVSFNMCVLSIIFDDSIELSATKIYENASSFVVAKYDLTLIEESITCVIFNKREFKIDDRTTIYDLNRTKTESCAIKSTVINIQSLKNTYELDYFYSSLHMKMLHFERRNNCNVEVLVNYNEKMKKLWLFFLLNEDMTYVDVSLSNLMSTLKKLQQESLSSKSRLLNVLLERVCKNDVTSFDVFEDMTLVIFYKTCRSSTNFFLNLFTRYFVRVAKIFCCHRELEVDDIILRHEDKWINNVSNLHAITYESLKLFVIRAHTEIQVKMSIIIMTNRLIDKVVWFCKAQMKMFYSSIHFDARRLYNHVWISRCYFDSSAQMYNLSTHRFVTRVNDEIIDDLKNLIRVLDFLSTNRDCQIICVDSQDITNIVSLKSNLRDFSTHEVRKMKRSQNWQFRELWQTTIEFKLSKNDDNRLSVTSSLINL